MAFSDTRIQIPQILLNLKYRILFEDLIVNRRAIVQTL